MTAVRRLLGRLWAALAWPVSAADGHPAPLAGLMMALWIIACLWFAHQVGRHLHDGYGGRPVMLERSQMRINQRGLELIKSFEGFRANAYRDAVGVWTIGYGHTAMAGEPKPVAGMSISQAEGEEILRRDVAKYERAVEDALKVRLTPDQFSALVSLCLNIGPGAFRKSSVLKAVNRGRHRDVPRLLMSWVKAGGRTLPGLVRRRAAEGALYAREGDTAADESRVSAVDMPHGKPALKSTTNWGAGLSGGAGLLTVGAAASGEIRAISDNLGLPMLALLAIVALVIAGGMLWVWRERSRFAREFDI